MEWKVEWEWEYDDEVSDEVNRERMDARISYLREYANENWKISIHAPGCAAAAEYLESLTWVDDIRGYDEFTSWDVTEDLMEDHMCAILDEWCEMGIYEAYDNHGYQWMLWATGYDINGVHEIVKKWLDENDDYYNKDKVIRLMNQTWGYED